MSEKTRLTKEEFDSEVSHSEEIVSVILSQMKSMAETIDSQKEDVLRDRQYFIDFFREMHADERNDWLQFEHSNLTKYDKSQQNLRKLSKQLAAPYFGKVIFNDSGREKVYYIGIYSLFNDYLPVIIDWRAPVSSLYYESEPGEASYTAKVGEKKGLLTQKRRFGWTDGVLTTAQNINMPSDDEFLREILAENASDRLKVIASSLQKDQNKIIRDMIDGVHVIAGCAGSGKSSVAMHKIAYIMYSLRDRIAGRDIVVLSPNSSFSAYISHILPDLGEDNVVSMTQEQFIRDILDGCIKYSERENSIERMLADEDGKLVEAVKFKNSARFLDLLNKYIVYYESHCFKAADIIYQTGDSGGAKEYKIRSEDLDFLFNVELSGLPVASRLNSLGDIIITKNHILDEEAIKQIRSSIEAMVQSTTEEAIYRGLYTDKGFAESLGPEFADIIAKFDDYNTPVLTFEDAVAVAYLSLKISDPSEDANVFYLFCDEAQDLSPVMLSIIKERYDRANMLFAGDIAQNVFANSDDYAELIKTTFKGKNFKKYELNVNYRSTKQISEFAKARTGRQNEISCVRDGSEPVVINVSSAEGDTDANTVLELNKWLKKAAESDYARCCVVTASNSESKRLLELADIPADLPRGKISFMPVYLAKGLEFDSVLLLNVGGSMVESDAKLGTNMFYTAATRAMHELTVLE
ncbi:MAG: AAA family ATPase [Clostridia bacterium]|nr:AAA family ATPase [Clostridia bacterium]